MNGKTREKQREKEHEFKKEMMNQNKLKENLINN